MMNKDEAVQKLATVGRLSIAHAEDLYDSLFEKPVVPQCVADWYEEHKWDFESELGCRIAIIAQKHDNEEFSDFEKWLNDNEQSLTTLVNMHQFGYEVENEPKYTVKIKGRLGQYLGKYYLNNEELTPQFTRTQYSEGGSFTRTELEANGFGWVFDCPGVEVTEVTDGND